MINEKLRLLIDKLLEKTIANQVNWNQSSGYNGYQLILSNGSLSVDNFWDDDSNQSYISVTLYNDNGENIDSITAGSRKESDDYLYLENFYKIVKRKYLKADETIDSFFKEINKDGLIGIVKKKQNEDLPF